MRRISTMLAAIFFLLAPLAAGTLTVTSPNGGETLTRGTAGQIAWTAVGVGDNVKLILLNADNTIYGVIVRDLAPGSSPYPWTVGDTEIGRAPAGSYKIRVSTMDGGTKDVSDAAFAIAEAGGPGPGPAGIRDVRLTGTPPYPIFNWVTVSWTASGISQEIDMELFRRDGSRVGTIYSLPAGTTSHGWLVGNFFSGMVGVGDYKIRVSSRDDAYSAESAVFSLVAPTVPPSLYINVPSQYDSWRPGSFHRIHWNISGWLPSLIQLSLRRAGAPEAEAPVLRLADGVGSHGEDGDFNWYIPPTLAEGRYFVRARVTASLFADSDVFAISAGGDPGATEGNAIWVNTDLALVGVGVEYYNGSIVAWVRNNGPDRLRSHQVRFRVSFPESGARQNITKELSIQVGHEEGVPLMELAASSIPSAGLRVIVDIEPAECNIRDTNRLNQHRDVRIFAR